MLLSNYSYKIHYICPTELLQISLIRGQKPEPYQGQGLTFHNSLINFLFLQRAHHCYRHMIFTQNSYKPVVLFPELIGHETPEAVIKIQKHSLMNYFTLYIHCCRVAQNMTGASPKIYLTGILILSFS